MRLKELAESIAVQVIYITYSVVDLALSGQGCVAS